MTRHGVRVAAAAAALVAVFAVALVGVHVTPPSIAGGTGVASPGTDVVTSVALSRHPLVRPPKRPHRVHGSSLLGVVVIVAAALLVVIAGAGLLVLGLAAARALRPRGRYTRRTRPRDAPPPVPSGLVRAVDGGLADLASGDGDSADAIIAAWLALRAAAAQSGVPARPTDTADDLVRRLLASWDVDLDGLTTLADLYREARFSRHRLTDTQRAAALDALGAIRAGLPVTADA